MTAISSEHRRTASPNVRGIGDRLRWPLVAAVPVAFLGAVFAYPLVVMFARSFTDFVTPGESGLANYDWFLGTSSQMTILRRTVSSALLVTALCLFVGFPYAYLMTVVKTRWRMVMLGAVLMPFWTSLIVRTYSWMILLGDNGPVVNFLHDLGFTDVRLLGTTTAVVIGMTQVMLPFLVLPLYSQLVQIDRTLLRAAQIHGARPSTAFRTVYLPLAAPGITAGSTIVFILSLGFYFTPALLGSPQNSLLSQQIVEQVTRLLAFGRGGAMALVLLVITLILLAAGSLVTRRYRRALGAGSEVR
ncbi:ABC transporter permease [Nocardioides aromaticivorans]|uniref:ABC transporter permease n=1 Tax=Nocardioides aromaticivorans TaxID=200618 RepID=UPI001A8C310B|nr:ABC transporter permease [Nocardioides aromaticivorans]